MPNVSTLGEVAEIVMRFRLSLLASAKALLATGSETPKRGEFTVDVRIIAAPSLALAAPAETARQSGLAALIPGDALEGRSRGLGTIMAGIAPPVGTQGLPVALPAVLLSGGETTLTIGRDGAGKGGRNTEFLLSFAVANEAQAGICALAGDSDGIDGTEDTAGAIVTPDTLTRGRAAGLDVPRYLTAHHNFSYFDALGDLVRTGPTLTHVDDIRAILIS